MPSSICNIGLLKKKKPYSRDREASYNPDLIKPSENEGPASYDYCRKTVPVLEKVGKAGGQRGCGHRNQYRARRHSRLVDLPMCNSTTPITHHAHTCPSHIIIIKHELHQLLPCAHEQEFDVRCCCYHYSTGSTLRFIGPIITAAAAAAAAWTK